MFKKFENEGMPLDKIRRKAFNEFNQAVYHEKIKLNRVSSCFCKAQDFLELSKLDRFGLPFGTQICKACGLVTQTLRIDDQSMPLFYDEMYWPLVLGGKKGFNTPPKKNEETPYIIDFIDKKKEKIKIFEIGCGSGNRIDSISSNLEDRGHKVEKFGCDYSNEALEIAKNKGIRVVQGGINEIVQFGTPDLLILSHVVEHFTDLNTEIEHIRELVDEHSLVYVEVPGIIDLENKKEYSFDYQMYNVLAHTYNFSLQTLTNVFSIGGFEIISGDEFVRAVFKKTSNTQREYKIVSSFDQTIQALERAYIKREKYQKKKSLIIYRYLKGIIKLILGRA